MQSYPSFKKQIHSFVTTQHNKSLNNGNDKKVNANLSQKVWASEMIKITHGSQIKYLSNKKTSLEMCRFRRQRIAWSCQTNMAVFLISITKRSESCFTFFVISVFFFNPFERETCTLFWMCYSSSLKPFFKLKRCWLFPHLTVFSFYPWVEVRCTSQSVSIPPIQIWFSSVAITFPLSWTAFRLIE